MNRRVVRSWWRPLYVSLILSSAVLVVGLLRKGHSWQVNTQAETAHSLQPNTAPVNRVTYKHSGQGRFVITVVSANRPGNVSYLSNTLQSLYCALGVTKGVKVPPAEVKVPPVVLVNTEVPSSLHAAVAALENDAALQYAQVGLKVVHMSSLHAELHSPEFVLELAKRTAVDFKVPFSAGEAASDKADRLWWRSKEVLDTAFALETAHQVAPMAEYIIFLEDDIMLAPRLMQSLEEFIASRAHAGQTADVINLFHADSRQASPAQVESQKTTQGLALHASLVQGFIQYARQRFAQAPVDYLLNKFFKQHRKSIWVVHPNLVEHVGLYSSLAGKKQPIVSATFADRGCWITNV